MLWPLDYQATPVVMPCRRLHFRGGSCSSVSACLLILLTLLFRNERWKTTNVEDDCYVQSGADIISWRLCIRHVLVVLSRQFGHHLMLNVVLASACRPGDDAQTREGTAAHCCHQRQGATVVFCRHSSLYIGGTIAHYSSMYTWGTKKRVKTVPLYVAWWLSGSALDLRLTGRGFNSRPLRFHVT